MLATLYVLRQNGSNHPELVFLEGRSDEIFPFSSIRSQFLARFKYVVCTQMLDEVTSFF